MRGFFRRAMWIFGGVAAVAVVSLYFGGRWAVDHFLSRDIRTGGGVLHVSNPEFRWSLNLAADSVQFESPKAQIHSGAVKISLSIFGKGSGILPRFAPGFSLALDSVHVALSPKKNSAKIHFDSLAFPDFKIPVALGLTLKRLEIKDTSGSLADISGLEINTNGPRAAHLSVARMQSDRRMEKIGTRADTTKESKSELYDGEPLSIEAGCDVDWSGAEVRTKLWSKQLGKGAKLAHPDSLILVAFSPKRNVYAVHAQIEAGMLSSRVYSRALGLGASLPDVRAAKLNIDLVRQGSLHVTVTGAASVSGLPDSGAVALRSQRVKFQADFRNSAGKWNLTSKGTRGEDLQLDGRFAFPVDSLLSGGDAKALVSRASAEASGHLRGVKVRTGHKLLPADVELTQAAWTPSGFAVDATTGDGTRVQARLDSSGRGDFSVELAAGEAWMKAFTDTNVAFRTFRIKGTMDLAGRIRTATSQPSGTAGRSTAKGSLPEISAELSAEGLRAYGVTSDSLRLRLRGGRGGIVLDPSRWSDHGLDWTISGKAGLGRGGGPYALRLEAPGQGSLEVTMPSMDSVEIKAADFALDKFPYRGLAAYSGYRPRVTLSGAWNFKRDLGWAKLDGHGRYRYQDVQTKAEADWNPDRLQAAVLEAGWVGNVLRASARVQMHGRPFYSFHGFKIKDVTAAEIAFQGLDLAEVARVARAGLPGLAGWEGKISGGLAFADSAGFSGTLEARGLKSPQTAKMAGAPRVEVLRIAGRGDSLGISAVTVADGEPWLCDTLDASLGGALGLTQNIRVRARSSGGVALAFAGKITNHEILIGRAALDGDVSLPGKSGRLRKLALRADLRIPFSGGLDSMRVAADTLSGIYAPLAQDTQAFSASASLRNGKLSVPDLRIVGKGGVLKGHLEYGLAAKTYAAGLSGPELTIAFDRNTARLRGIQVEAKGDASGVTASAQVEGGSVVFSKSPLRADASFSNLNAQYRLPLGKPKATSSGTSPSVTGMLPFLKLSLVMDSSDVRYKVRNLDALQNMFKRKPGARRSKPMQVQIDVETAGSGNTIDTDVLRMAYVGSFSMIGTYPYALVRGRVSAREGTLGARGQAYDIRRFDINWPNTPVEDGAIDMEAYKKLARNCEGTTQDSCSIIMRLGGSLSGMQFSYDSDCQGSFGAGADVSALVFSIQRGCYSPGASSGGGGLTYQEQALTLLENPLNGYLSDAAQKLSGRWIASAQISGLGALAQDKTKNSNASSTSTSSTSSASSTTSTSTPSASDTGSAGRDAIALEVLSKEVWRLRLRAKSAYSPDNAQVNPWAYRVGVEWRPPLARFIQDSLWKRRISNNVNVDASVFTDPDRTQGQTGDQLLRRLGLNYTYDFWGRWGTRLTTVASSVPGAPASGPHAPGAPGAASHHDTSGGKP